MWYQFPSASTLHLASLELYGIVVLCKLSIVRTLTGTICIQVFNRRIRDTFTVFHGLLKKMAVCKYCCFNLNGSYDARLALLYSLCDIGHIALHLLVVLGTIGCIKIIRIQDCQPLPPSCLEVQLFRPLRHTAHRTDVEEDHVQGKWLEKLPASP